MQRFSERTRRLCEESADHAFKHVIAHQRPKGMKESGYCRKWMGMSPLLYTNFPGAAIAPRRDTMTAIVERVSEVPERVDGGVVDIPDDVMRGNRFIPEEFRQPVVQAGEARRQVELPLGF